MFDVIVIGGGPAGVTAALRAQELGATVALIEQGRMGGTCTNDGCAPTRVLAKAARLIRDAEQFPNFGLEGQPPTVNLPELLNQTQQTIYRLQEKKQLLEHLDDVGVEVLSEVGLARFLDQNTVALGDGRLLEGEKFILCAGGHARRIAFPGSEHALTHSDIWTLRTLPRSLAVIGGAATGCQLASIFADFGSQVSILDVAPRILSVEDELISQAVGNAFRERGIRVIADIDGVNRIEKTPETFRLAYGYDGVERTLEADLIIMAVGWVGNVAGLNLAAAGVTSAHGYIQVDDRLKTSADHIYAAGDITGRMMLVQSATHEARVAAENAVLGSRRSFRHQIVPHGGFTDPEYGSVGLTETQAHAAYDCVVAVVPYADLDRAVIDGRPEGFCKLIVSREFHNVLGAHVVGEQALEVVQIASAGMAAGIHVQQLAELQLAYPTFTAIIGLAARQLVRALGLTPLAPEWRALRRLEGRSAEWESQA